MRKLALLLVAAPLALAACGSSSATGVKADAVAYVRQAGTKTADLKSMHMALTEDVTAAGQKITLDGSGDFASNPLRGTFALSTSGGIGSMREVFDGTNVYVNAEALSTHLPAGKTWLKANLAQLGKATHLSLMSQNPKQVLEQLAAGGSVKSLGTETIDGVTTTHYQVSDLEVSKLSMLPKALRNSNATVGPIDVWIGNGDGYVYRLTLSVDATEGGQSASVDLRVDLSKFNEPVHVTIPPESETVGMGPLG